MTDAQLTDLLAESSHAFEDRTSGVSRHLQWHTELAEELQTMLAREGYAVLRLPEPETSDENLADWDQGTVWTKPGSGKVRLYIEDSRFTAEDARTLGLQLLAAADASSEKRKS